MTNSSVSAQLAADVEVVIHADRLVTFQRYWELYNRTVPISKVRRFFIRTESRALGSGYCKVAIVGDGLIVDIEGDDNDRSGNLSFTPLDSIAEVSLHAGFLPGLPASQEALLVVIADREGESDLGLHWIAKTSREEERLLKFAQGLIHAMSNQ